jgi:SAM-dependent methyltransferase
MRRFHDATVARVQSSAVNACTTTVTAAYCDDMSDSSWLSSMPEVYDRCLGPTVFAPYAVDLARRAAQMAPHTVLELAAGTGILTAALMAALPDAEIVATDINPPMVGYATSRVNGPTWQVADAQDLPYPEHAFSLVASQFGVMFLPDRITAYRGIRRVLEPGGFFLFNAWDRLETHTIEAAVIDIMAELFPTDPPDFLRRVPHGYADPDRIRADVDAAGFPHIDLERVALQCQAPSAVTLAEGYCLGTPLRFELAERGDPLTFVEPVAEALTRRLGSEPVEYEMSAHVVVARTG